MEVIAAAGLCAPGCVAAVSAFAGGPMLGAVSMAAAVGYGIYSFATGNTKSDDFEDAIDGEAEEEEPRSPVVKVALQPRTGQASTNSGPNTASFL